MKKKLAIIGHFGGKEVFNDGQTVKTLNLYNELTNVLEHEIEVIDTYYNKKNPVKLLFQTLKMIATTENAIILISKNGMKVFFPLLYLGKKFFKLNVFHDVIGGNFGSYIDQNPKFVKYMNSFNTNIVETEMLKNDLLERGVMNVDIIPNFRRMPRLSYEDLQSDYREPYSFCTFSRVIKEKGIEDAISAIEEINRRSGREVCKLDIYGPIDHAYQERFDSILSNVTSSVQYKGEVPASEAMGTLKNYYGVLFPTYWPSESNAGTISESFFAGVPVIATDWRCNGEMIDNGQNGLIYPSQYAETLIDGMEWLMQRSPQEMFDMKKHCVVSSEYYLPDRHINRLVEMMEL